MNNEEMKYDCDTKNEMMKQKKLCTYFNTSIANG